MRDEGKTRQQLLAELEQRFEKRTAELATANKELAIFRKFVDASAQGFSMADLDGHITYLNTALCRMLGEERPEDVLGKHLSVHFSEESNRRGKEEIEPALSREGYWKGELTMLSRQGTSIPTWHHTFLIRDEQGTPFRIAVVIADITEPKRAEEALRLSRDELRTLYEGVMDGLAVVDIETARVVRINAALCEMLGFSEAELLSLSAEQRHPSDVLPRLREHFDAVGKGANSWLEDMPCLTSDGRVRHFDARAKRIDYAGRPSLLIFMHDTTERRKAEEALRQSHVQLQAISDGMVDGFVIFDIDDFQIVRANTALCALLGYSEEELKALTPEQKNPADALPKIRAHYEAVLQGRESRYNGMPCIKKDGSLLYFDVAAKHILYNGRRSFLVFFHDVTERRLARIALERERRTLKHMLRASDHERQVIAYDIHDGLAQQLAGAIMQFQVYDHLEKTQPDEARRAYNGGMALLRQGYGEARRLISGVRPPILDEAGVVAAISHLVNERGMEHDPNIEVHSKVQFTRLAPILENAIYRIVQEALTNACKHSKSAQVRISLLQRNGHLRIEIRDWGIGFDPKTVRENRYGLEGIRERARLLGGKFAIRSKPNEGTSVIAEVPIAFGSQPG